MSNETVDYFEGFREWDALKWTFIAFHVLLTFLCPPALCSIIWYENYGSNAHYRTVVNILLSHSCSFMLHLCLWARIPYVMMLAFGPNPILMCEMSIMVTKWGLLCIIIEVTLWQLMKYMFIFRWHNVVAMDDDFIAFFLTLLNVLLTAIFVTWNFMVGLANVEMEYQICTGRNPIINIKETPFSLVYFSKSENLLKELADADFTRYVYIFFIFLNILVTLRIWIYDKKPKMQKFWSKVVSFFKRPSSGTSLISNQPGDDGYDYVSKTKSIIIGAGGSLLIGMIILLLALPSYFSKNYTSANFASVNYGPGRLFYYLSRMSLTLLRNFSLPVICFVSSRKLRNCIWTKVKSFL